MQPYQVMLVEDDAEWRQALADYFRDQQNIELTALAGTVQECFSELEHHRFDVVLMDIMLDEYQTSGLDAALDITYRYPQTKVIMLTSLDNDDEVFNEAFMNGAYDYIYKYDFEQLPDIINRAMKHPQSKYGDRLRKLVFEQKRRLLTPRDLEILMALARKQTLKSIAQAQDVSVSAVKKQLNRLFHKFGWNQSGQAFAEKCRKWGLLDEMDE